MLQAARIALAALTLAVSLTLVPVASAVPEAQAQTLCRQGTPWNLDMAGTYRSPQYLLDVTIYACGGVYVQWGEDGVIRSAAYATHNHLAGGGIATIGISVDPSTPYLGGTDHLVIKPAEPGWVQVVPWDQNDGALAVYRLRKIT